MRAKDDSVRMIFSAEAWDGLYYAESLHRGFTDRELVVTSGSEDIAHSVPRSAHHRQDAFDMRRWYLADNALDYVVALENVLGDDWVIILEDNHIHCHWAPVQAT